MDLPPLGKIVLKGGRNLSIVMELRVHVAFRDDTNLLHVCDYLLETLLLELVLISADYRPHAGPQRILVI